MPFKSERCCLRQPTKKSAASGRPSAAASWAVAAAIVSLGVLAEPAAQATLTVSAGSANPLVNNTNFYYATKPIQTGANIFLDTALGFRAFDLSQGIASSSESQGNRQNMLLFTLRDDRSDLVANATQQLAMGAYVQTNSSSIYVPIAAVSQSPGSGLGSFVDCTNPDGSRGSGGCVGQTTVNGITYQVGAPYAATSTIQIGIYIHDLCQAAGGTSAFPSVCPATASPPAAITNGGQISLTFFMDLVPNQVGAAPTTTDPTKTAEKSAPFQLNFTNNTSSTSCSAGTLQASYTPGDEQITVHPQVFGASQGSGTAPVITLIVVGRQGSAVDLSPTFATSGTNTIIARLPSGQDGAAGPFVNSVPGTSHPYNVAFALEDAAGFVFRDANPSNPPSGASNPDTACSLSNVETAEIQGFLTANKCFIATAAFRAGDIPPIHLLRMFRDQVLERSPWGQAFVRWYYAWSPSAADWLIENPSFRYPVLLALVPLQGLAWLALHRAISYSLLALAAGLLAFALLARHFALDRGRGAAR